MKINQDNYEQYFLDFAEGSLSPEMEKELEDFLQANPDLRPLLSDLDLSPLPAAEIHNHALKQNLKKNIRPTKQINEANAEEWMIRQVEGLLDEKEEKELAEFIWLNPAYAYDQEKFRQAKLLPDLSVTYYRKEQLKKKAALLPIFRLSWLVPAAAALVLLFIGIRYLQQPAEIVPNPDKKTVAEIPVTDVSKKENLVNENLVNERQQSSETAFAMNTPAVQPVVTSVSPDTRSASFRLKPSKAGILETNNQLLTALFSDNPYTLSIVRFPEEKEKPMIAKVFNNMVAQVKDGFNSQVEQTNIDKTDFSLWGLARVGVNGYNSVADRDLELYVHRGEDGKVTSYALVEQDRLLMEKNLGKN